MAEIKQFKTFRDLKNISEDKPSASTPSSARYTSTTRVSRNTSKPRISSTPSTTNQIEVSPIRDYQKVPNSITREAVPSGMFRGKSKLVYDLLWSKSRGKINPARTVKISRREIKKETAIGSMVTIDAALNHLQTIGLIQVVRTVGSLSGNQYEIFAPDELSSTPSISSISSPTQKLDKLDALENGNTRQTQIAENKDTYSPPKTLFKDFEYIDDDSPLYEALRALNRAAEERTGKGLKKEDIKPLVELFALFISETNLAAGRAKSVSSYTALGVENLRRRLYPKTKPKASKPTEWQTIGKSAELPEPLGDEMRRTVLESLRQIVEQSGREAVEMFSGNYTQEDWTWLMKELKRDV